MRTGTRYAAAAAAAAAVLAGAGAWRARAASAAPAAATAPEDENRFPGQDANAAYDDPSRLAWRQFASVNAPAVAAPPATTPGAPPAAAWELWASAEEVFADPDRVPVWPAPPSAPAPTAAAPRRRFERGLVQQRLFRQRLAAAAPAAAGALAAPAEAEAGEVRFNRTAFDWIVLKQLWYLEGQQKAYDFWAANQPSDVAFPEGSVLVKAAWRPIAESEKPRFHWREHEGRPWGLVALHVTSKILPGWFWATFEQVDNPGRPAVAHPDPFGLGPDGEPSPALLELLGAAGLDRGVWSHYRLDGTQTDYVGLDGAPVVLANSVIEAGFTERSSCRTCHARATIGAGGARLSFDPLVGAPDPAWFTAPGPPPVREFLQLDFAWSLTRAKAQTAAK